MFEKIFAITILVVCIALMARLLAGPRRRLAIDAWARRVTYRLRGTWLHLYHWRSSRQTAKQVADEAIRRAREDKGRWEGNVYKPKSFKRPPRDKMH
ncbi:MAG TPA: hypothetical protein VHQ87_14300 [Rhizobacter sp.]|nr:hypothetical protein [Rhizobacter sp.]